MRTWRDWITILLVVIAIAVPFLSLGIGSALAQREQPTRYLVADWREGRILDDVYWFRNTDGTECYIYRYGVNNFNGGMGGGISCRWK